MKITTELLRKLLDYLPKYPQSTNHIIIPVLDTPTENEILGMCEDPYSEPLKIANFSFDWDEEIQDWLFTGITYETRHAAPSTYEKDKNF